MISFSGKSFFGARLRFLSLSVCMKWQFLPGYLNDPEATGQMVDTDRWEHCCISPYFLGIFIYVNILERWFTCGPPRYYFEAISDMELRRFSWPKLAKTSPPSLYFKIILYPVSVFLRNYFFLLTASSQKLFREKTLWTAHGRFKISQMRRLTFHLTSLRYSDRHVI